MVGKAWLRTVTPFAVSCGFNIMALVAVVIDNDFLTLPSPFTWCEDNGSCIFEHRDEVGHHDGLGKEVFGSAEETGALPFPLFRLDIVVAAVTGPNGKVSPLQSLSDVMRFGNVFHPWSPMIVNAAPHSRVVFMLEQSVGHQLLQLIIVRLNLQIIVVIG